MDNNACQACHQQRFESFGADHPEFGRWPYERRTPIAFDHASHQGKHFRDKNQAFDCRRCHVEDRTRDVQLLTGYETACAACHDEKIATSAARGVPLLALPTLDVAALRAAGRDIGPWPAAATGDFDGRLPPAMKLLLSADPSAARAIARLGPDVDFFDVDADDREDLAAAADLAVAIKKLLGELSESGPAAMRARLQRVFERDLSNDEFAALVGGLSADTSRPAISAWLDHARNGAGNMEKPTPSAPGAWFYDAATLSIRYLPTGHADPLLTAWATQLAVAESLSDRPLNLAAFKEMTQPTAPGLCASCHSVEQAPNGAVAIHWRAADRSAGPRAFTEFSHGPHLLLPELADCAACHKIDPQSDSSKSYSSWNAAAFVSDFRPIAKQDCAACHTSRAAGDQCQSCHNYHVRVESLELSAEGLSIDTTGTESAMNRRRSQPSTLDSQPFKTSSGTRPARR
jgi:hypothetical protein